MTPDPKLLALEKLRRYSVCIMYDPTPAKLREVAEVVAEVDAIPGPPADREQTPRLLAVYQAVRAYLEEPSHAKQIALGNELGDWVRGRYKA